MKTFYIQLYFMVFVFCKKSELFFLYFCVMLLLGNTVKVYQVCYLVWMSRTSQQEMCMKYWLNLDVLNFRAYVSRTVRAVIFISGSSVIIKAARNPQRWIGTPKCPPSAPRSRKTIWFKRKDFRKLIRKIETMMRIYVNIFFTKWFYRPECFKI